MPRGMTWHGRKPPDYHRKSGSLFEHKSRGRSMEPENVEKCLAGDVAAVDWWKSLCRRAFSWTSTWQHLIGLEELFSLMWHHPLAEIYCQLFNTPLNVYFEANYPASDYCK
ncbi:hypothetical protein Syun_020717 [Stephania yunnanensis]|uniref:Uncharacterized protein n=1 Tax=Stephania yunnanensis TaxID=152371 RepID=A0AAP0NQA2_9MAGN